VKVDLDDRYARQRLLTWWDQGVLAASRVLVVGAGALGNEIAKNLALVGVGHLTIIDLDLIERSNLSRCVFFRPGEEGRSKAELAAERVRALNPEIEVEAIHGNVMALGLGRVAGFDLVVAGLDNREARLWINRACRKLGMTWVDGAIEGLRGVARVFGASGACYECTLSEVDREILARRTSCALLSPEEVELGKVPTTATSSSIIAGLQCQEAVRILHRRRGAGEAGLADGTGLMFVGETLETYPITYSEDPYCGSHDRYGPLVPFAVDAATRLTDVVEAARALLGQVDAIDLESDLVLGGRCAPCELEQPLRLYAVTAPREAGRCPSCGEMLAFELRVSITPDDEVATWPVLELGFPDREVLTVRRGSDRVHYVLETP
jgi:molybdopterin/thiamine biosynthesis adenylyltransferase